MNSIAYNIPVSLIEDYRGRKVIVRARESSELVEAFSESDLENLLYIKLLSLTADVDALANWGFSMPVDLALVRYVTDDGVEGASPRFAGTPYANASSLDDFQKALLAEQGECCGCEFWLRCGGYFKWPRREFACDGVKAIFHNLREAADELRKDVAAYSEPG